MVHIELHASEGGADSKIFASQLAEAIGKHTSLKLSEDTRVVTLSGRL